MLPNPDYGTRAIYTNPKGLSILGVIVRKDGHRLTMQTDKGGKLVEEWTPASESFQQVSYWRSVPKTFKNPEVLHKYVDYTPVSALFKENNPVKVTEVLLKCMWVYANEHGFNGKLTEPKFKVTTDTRIRGTYFPSSTAPQINVSSVNTTYALVFRTMVHEMCHQYNEEIELMGGLITRDDIKIEQGHGPVFKAIAEKVGQKLGVKIDRFYDVETKGEEAQKVKSVGVKKSPPYVFMLLIYNKNYILGYTATNLVKAYELLDELSHGMMQARAGRGFASAKIFGGVSRLAPPKKYLHKKFTGFRAKPLPPEAVLMLENDVEPVDFLDSMEDFKEVINSL